MPWKFPFIKYGMKFVKIGPCRYCFQTNAVSMHGTCIVCKQKMRSRRDRRKRENRKLDPVALAAYRKRDNRTKAEWLARIKIEDPAKYREHQIRKTVNKRNSKRRQIIRDNKQRLIAIKKELDDGTI